MYHRPVEVGMQLHIAPLIKDPSLHQKKLDFYILLYSYILYRMVKNEFSFGKDSFK